MSRTALVILAGSLGFVDVSTVAQVPESVAVVLESRLASSSGTTGGALELLIQNRSESVITAWGVSIRCPGAEFTPGLVVDGWLALEQARRAGTAPSYGGLVLPGHTLPHVWPRGCGRARGVLPDSVTLKLVVFEDGRWIGESPAARSLFSSRREQRERWAETLAVIEDVHRSMSGLDALLTLQARLEPLAGGPDARTPASTTLGGIAKALDQSRPNQQPPGIVLEELLREARFHVDASAPHVRPSPEF